MSTIYNAEEVLEIACQIERNGARFYRKAAKLVALSNSQDLLLDLALMEDGHEKTFLSMKSNTEEFDNFIVDPDNSAAAYLQAIASNHVFVSKQDPNLLFNEETTAQKVLKTALDAEFASITFFRGIHDNLEKGWGKDKIMSIIKEEQEHVVILNKKVIQLR